MDPAPWEGLHLRGPLKWMSGLWDLWASSGSGTTWLSHEQWLMSVHAFPGRQRQPLAGDPVTNPEQAPLGTVGLGGAAGRGACPGPPGKVSSVICLQASPPPILSHPVPSRAWQLEV